VPWHELWKSRATSRQICDESRRLGYHIHGSIDVSAPFLPGCNLSYNYCALQPLILRDPFKWSATAS
jgi:hypothetical protein